VTHAKAEVKQNYADVMRKLRHAS